jgi:type IV secretion system protein VirB8
MKTDVLLEPYFREAQSWDGERRSEQRRLIKLSFWVAGAGWVCALGCVAALVALMPLKRTDPFLIRVDTSSGVVDVVPVYAGNAPLPEAVTRYFLNHYVTVCERFDFATAESDYEECGAFHSPARNQQWFDQWNRNNPQSPLNLYKDGSVLKSDVSAISFFERASGVSDLAQVRYTKLQRQGSAEHASHWIATIQYAYGRPATDPKIRRWNPLGFKVISFRSEPEVLNEGAVAQAAGGAP